MFDAERLLGQLVNGALGGSLGGRIDRKRRHSREHSRGDALGGLLSGAGINKAQVGLGLLGVAMAAWEHYSQNGKSASPAPAANAAPAAAPMMPPPPPPPPAGFDTGATRAAPLLDLRRQQAMLLIRTMIAACAADGRIDEDERAGVLDRARSLGDDAETLQFLQAELANPVSAGELVAQTPRSLAAEVYAAAALAIEIDTEHERQWLDGLAHGLGLSPQARAELHQQIGLA